MNSPVGFFKAFFGSCAGLEIFRRLQFQPWGRTIWHILLLSIICGFIAGGAVAGRHVPRFEAVKTIFCQTFGNELLSGGRWLIPGVKPAENREIALPDNGRLYYRGTNGPVPESLKTVTGQIALWTPEFFCVAQQNGGSYAVLHKNFSENNFFVTESSLAQVRELFTKPVSLPPESEKMHKLPVDMQFAVLKSLFTTAFRFGFALWQLALVWLYTGIFMLMFRLLNGKSGRLRNLTLSGMWKCGIYAAMPAMAIATCFPALDLPFVNYETVFMLALLIYWMVITARLERSSFNQGE